jgi:hypothetical protein
LGSIGVWLVRQVGDGIAQATAASAALAVDSLLASSVAKLASQDALSPARVSRLDHQLAASQLGQHLESVLRIEISDDGPDFDATEMGIESRYPVLQEMRDRAESLGGTVRIASTPEHGTRVVATLPLPPPGRSLEDV